MANAHTSAALRPSDAAVTPASGDGAVHAGNLWWKAAKQVIAIAAWPLCLGLAGGLYAHQANWHTCLRLQALGFPEEFRWFCWGALAFGLLAIVFWRPIAVYVWAHEVAHALAAWLCWAKVTNLRASVSGGQVTTSKSNTFIRLAPYCVPVYLLLLTLLYYTLGSFWPVLQAYRWLYCFAAGALYLFHLGFTLWSLHGQSDFKTDGYLFSLTAVYLANLVLLAAVLALVLKENPQAAARFFAEGLRTGWEYSVRLYSQILNGVEKMATFR